MYLLIHAHRRELMTLPHRRGLTGVKLFGSMMRGDLWGRDADVVTEASLHPALRKRILVEAVPL